jgi:hypothetical protein
MSSQKKKIVPLQKQLVSLGDSGCLSLVAGMLFLD